MVDYIEFSAKIKEKYPEYKDVDDLVLAQKIVEKYPEYKEQVTFDEVKQEPKIKKGIDLTPSGIAKQGGSALSALVETPFRMVKDNQSLPDAFKSGFNEGMEAQEQMAKNQPIAVGSRDFLTDMAGYSALPVLRGGGALNFIGNAAIQGGIPGVVEGLKRNENPLLSGGAGTGIAAALQGISPVAAKGFDKLVNSEFVKNQLPKVLEGLTSVPAEYSQRAIDAELAGNSILNGKFNEKTAYRPIEEKLTQAKEMLPTKEDFAQEYYKLGKKASEGLEGLKTQAGQNIAEMLGNLSDKPLDISNLKNALEGVVKSFARGGDINPAEIRAGRDIEQIKNLLGIKSPEEVKDALKAYYNKNKVNFGGGEEVELNKEAKDVAFDILAQATGKNKRWLQSQLNANMPKMSTLKRQEFIEGLIDSTADKIDNIDPYWQNYFPEFNWENLQEGGADTAELVQKLFDRIVGNDFKSMDLVSPWERAIMKGAKDYSNLLGEVTVNPTKNVINKSYDKLQDILSRLPNDVKEDFILKYSNDLDNIQNIINPKVKPIDLHNVKELLYDVANYDTAGGIRNDAIKGIANQINNYLRRIEPNYARPNDTFSAIKWLEKELGGLNPNTVGSKISNIGGKGNALSGMDLKLKSLDDILPGQNKFFKQAQEIGAEQDAINEINNAITQKYLDNARPLADKSSMRFEKAIDDLQNRTGVKFADELKDIRAREALEKYFPGQGGGSGSSQGFGNLLRTALIGGSPTAAVVTGNPAALAGLALVSPKIMAKGTIKNIGKLNNFAKNAAKGAYDEIINRLSNLGAKGAANMLYGGVEYNDYR